MASMNPTPAAKQLGEILQDQQEPFTLQLYLLEKGYNASINKTPVSSTNKKRVLIPACPKILRATFSKLASINLRIKNPNPKIQDFGIRKIIKGTRQEYEDERSSSASSTTTVFLSCSGSDIEEKKSLSKQKNLQIKSEAPTDIEEKKSLSKQKNLQIKSEAPTDKILPSTYEEENKQQSPVSVLEVAVLSGETSPVESRNEIIMSSDQSSQYNKIKMALQQTRQLLFDCMKDVQTQVMSKKEKNTIINQSKYREITGPGDLGKLICENIWTWSRQGTKPIQMLLTLQEWTSFGEQRKEIAIEMADFILQDITNLIVAEMLQ